jgi:hypothetical protein
MLATLLVLGESGAVAFFFGKNFKDYLPCERKIRSFTLLL